MYKGPSLPLSGNGWRVFAHKANLCHSGEVKAIGIMLHRVNPANEAVFLCCQGKLGKLDVLCREP